MKDEEKGTYKVMTRGQLEVLAIQLSRVVQLSIAYRERGLALVQNDMEHMPDADDDMTEEAVELAKLALSTIKEAKNDLDRLRSSRFNQSAFNMLAEDVEYATQDADDNLLYVKGEAWSRKRNRK